jgi:hypothetical protein
VKRNIWHKGNKSNRRHAIKRHLEKITTLISMTCHITNITLQIFIRKLIGNEEPILTVFISSGMTRKPEEINGASSGKCSSIGANTSWKEDPTDFSSIPVQS